MTRSLAVGIDLGTTCSVLARVDESGRSAMLRHPLGDLLIPSVVFFEDDELVFGAAARQAAASAPNLAAEGVKRDLGQAGYARAIGGRVLPCELIEACLLAQLVADLPTSAAAQAPAVVLTLPACFNQAQRAARTDAARIAGVDLLGIVDEPLAASLALAEAQGYLKPEANKPGQRVLVFDLGGGKLDVAIIEIKPRRLRVLAVAGDPRLGGRDWDARLAEHLAARFQETHGQDPRYDMASVRRLTLTAEETKHTLTTRGQARVRIDRAGQAADMTISREEFEQATGGLLPRAHALVEQVLSQAALAWRDLAHVQLVGGATRMPVIGQMLSSITGLAPATAVHPDEAVARGAALVAEQLLAQREGRQPTVPFELVDLTTYSLGIEWLEEARGRGENVVLIPRGTELPCVTTTTAATDAPNQPIVAQKLLEGESRDPARCARIGRAVIGELPSGLPPQTKVEVRYGFAPDGQLTMSARLAGGTEVPAKFERQHALAPADLEAWREVVHSRAGLKAILERLPEPAPVQAVMASHAPAAARPTESVSGEDDDAPRDQDEAPAEGGLVAEDDADAASFVPKTRRRTAHSLRFQMLNAVGYLVFSILGLAIGYYLFLVLRPEWNSLNLPLPSLDGGQTTDAPAPGP